MAKKNQASIPTDALSLLEQDPKNKRIVSILSAIGILVMTFALPASIFQFFQNNVFFSQAISPHTDPTITSYLAYSAPPVSQPSPFVMLLSSYWWIILIAGILIIAWIALIIAFVSEKRK